MNETEARARFHAEVSARVKRDRRGRIVRVDASLCDEDPASGQVFVYAETEADRSAYVTSFCLGRGERFCRDRTERAFLAEAAVAAAVVRI